MRNVVRSVETEYRTAASQEASLQASLEAAKQEALEVNRKAIEFGVLKREVETNQQLYKELLTRNKQTGLESELKTTNIRIVEKAEAPRAPDLAAADAELPARPARSAWPWASASPCSSSTWTTP